MITKLTFGFTLLASAFFYFSNNNSDFSSKTNYITTTQQQTPLEKSMARGKEVYTDFCIQCHLATGKGNGTTFPPLDGSNWLKTKITQSIHAVKYGQKGEILVNQKKFNSIMPALGLSDEEIADVMNYVLNSWSNKSKKMITVKEVALVKP
ncbi:cytochrome c [Flavobacterium sp. FZUC8N2.13]|uniref:Cytochrome c n=1 Tax=Flavobacterium zubiriense TaxID=3138075 RepID=A0ABV4THD6_9FLAO